MLAPGLLALQTVRASAVLLGAGAWDAAPTELFVSRGENAMLQITYTRGGAGGAVDLGIECSIYTVAATVPAGASEWGDATAYGVGVVAAGVDTASLTQDEVITFTSQGAAAESFMFGPLTLGGVVERIRIYCRESGAVGTPGTVQITMNVQ